jgi:hypothetical protein
MGSLARTRLASERPVAGLKQRGKKRDMPDCVASASHSAIGSGLYIRPQKYDETSKLSDVFTIFPCIPYLAQLTLSKCFQTNVT